MLNKKWVQKLRIPGLGRTWASEGARFDGPYPDWAQAEANCTGYDSESILEKVVAATRVVESGAAVFERDSVLFYEESFVWPVVAGLNYAAAMSGGTLNVLDFGGALGSSYFQSRGLLAKQAEIRWNIVEQNHYVEAGKRETQGDQLRFYTTIEDCLSENKVNAVLLSGVLQYLEEPYVVLRELQSLGCEVVIMDRTILNSRDVNEIYVQHVPETIYSASYPCASLSARQIIAAMDEYYDLKSDFSSLRFPALRSIDSQFRGLLFTRK
ncbi:MAG: methyltransferase, TIGR04325 family [Halioglobus sp.]